MSLLELNPFIQKILQVDHYLMLKINRDWQSPLFDHVSLFIREASFWAPVYVFLLLFITLNFGKQGIWWALALIGLIALSDILSSHVIKELLYRPRPCRDAEMAGKIRFLAKTCGLNGSFTSSHATNHFAIAMFVFQTLRRSTKLWALGFIWAGAISYAQVYVGVHYPIDVIGGAVLGAGLGYVAASLFNHQTGLGLDQ